MKRLLIITLAMCLLCASALADAAYTVLPAEIDVEAFKELVFGERTGDANVETRDDGQVHFFLPETDGPPFCSYTPWGIQMRIHAYGGAWSNSPDTYNSPRNVFPSGISECLMTRDKAQAQATEIIERLGIGEYAIQSITAYGRIPGYRDCYTVAFLQRLNGRAVYWSSGIEPSDYDEYWYMRPQTNRVEITLDESGIIQISGAWCRYEPTGG